MAGTSRKKKKANPATKKTGLPPGSLVHTGQRKMETVKISLFSFNPTFYEEKILNPNDLDKLVLTNDKIYWINIDGLHDIHLMESISNKFNLHMLVMEDVLNVFQIPKIDAHEKTGVLFLTLNEFHFPIQSEIIETDQISIILKENFLISFQERESTIFNPVINRLRNGNSRLRNMGTGYLCYSMLDTLVDSYGDTLEKFDDDFYQLEEEILSKPHVNQLRQIHRLTKNMITMRKSAAPVKEIIQSLIKTENDLITEDLLVYLKDLLDHINKVIFTIDSDRESLNNMINTNMTNQSTKMNETIKVLTVISTIFIPLSFLVGVYGMNFRNMPELENEYGYFILLGVIVVIIAAQLIFFRHKRWL
ncbi:MAG: magnesium/cobalt transporter CorA [Chitinophagales bacterium]